VIGYSIASEGFLPYGIAIGCAALGAGAAYLVVSNLSPLEGSMAAGMTTDESYSHADASNPYSPSGFGQSSSNSDDPYSANYSANYSDKS